MRSTSMRTRLAAGLAILLWPALVRADDPPRPTRAQSGFGLHFDLHASLDITNAGEGVTEELVEELVTKVRPDFIQIDCKGHPGISSYPTKVPDATHVAGFARDPLAVYRKVTAKHGVALYLHYSGIWDSRAVQQHPDWAAQTADGKPSPNQTSIFGPYVDRILIPQLRELRNVYGADGVWIDGECWAMHPDYRPDAIEAFRKSTGIDIAPKSPADPHYKDLLEFTRGSFRGYVRHYLDDLHRTAPGLQIASNWAFSSRMPDPVDLPVDFLSGDFSPMDSVRVGAFEARCLEPQARSVGKPWDLMDWSFAHDWSGKHPNAGPKPAVQLEQSASEVLALGGAYQAYFKQGRDLAFHREDIPRMAELAAFCRERLPITKGATPVHEVALLYSTAGWKRDTNEVYQIGDRDTGSLQGLLDLLMDQQLGVEILMTHHLRGHVKEYALIAVPDWEVIEPELKAEIVDHVRHGGKLLLAGPRIVKAFADVVGTAAPSGEPPVIAAAFGDGRVVAFPTDIGREYHRTMSPKLREVAAGATGRLLPERLVRVSGASGPLHVVPTRKDGKLLINLINVAGPHADPDKPTFDAIPPSGPFDISVALPDPPRSVRLEPGATALAPRYENGRLNVHVPGVAIHGILVVE